MIRWLRRVLLSLLVLCLLLALVAWLLLRGSLATLDGQRQIAGLSGPVSISRDALGTVTIEAGNPVDAARALGYVHAQERYFEMDLMRRTSAGELAALFGARALPLDRRHRLHRMRARAEAGLDAFAGDHRAELDAYTAGVNAGLAALRVRPWPYLLLRQRPQPWTAADAVLTGDAMYFDLQDADDARALSLWKLQQRLPPALFALLGHDGSHWDAPLQGAPREDAVLPGADVVDLRTLPAAASAGAGGEALAPGSNNFAVAAAHTADGRAIVADDMHLALRAPNLWFRVRLRYADPRAPGGRVDVTGFSLPGLPAVIVGSNTHVAWGFTNGFADTADLFRITPCAATPAPGCAPVRVYRETLAVAGAAAQTLEVRQSAYGPLVEDLPGGQALALRWVGHLPGALNLGLDDFARAGDLDDALRMAGHVAVPAQNLLLADAGGRIAWRLLGPLPQRTPGCEASALVLPSASAAFDAQGRPAAPCPAWPISTQLVEPLADPADGRLWTANNRVADGPLLAVLGDGGYVLGARARQIRNDLQRLERADERSLLAVQLDDRAVFLQRWWALLQREAQGAPPSSALAALAKAADHWDGRASADSVSFRLVRRWRLAVQDRIAEGLVAPAGVALDRPPAALFPQLEGVVWPLLEQRPAHLLPRRFACAADQQGAACEDTAGWSRLLEEAADETRRELTAIGPLAKRTWGEQNTAAICHPLAAALPARFKSWLCMPPDRLPGAGDMPRVQAPAFGASERMVVSPGHEADGFVHMPGGQSGHPMSPFWGAGHADWVQGRGTPFLPGPAQHTLQLVPAR
ncbi:penicillin acylase family protein [Pseudoxanthomonas winnipegensis]|uniref:Penicillin acylase family protein n=1 Tax=Pseudoxanthomonas winnipegensis TaxID=2480810 RepID=A0A4Q8L995_9GAMM|nr:penicillin acylase family protein [Pseudoxanthomonas winnipegensis]RZZ82740.1 penicillin acylase family protein [Pseudoxanthomonas winnipegensis]TAA24968.1 penicillin acylase family protein [Pseudoxanthomonas winnipegensis]TBV75255.1 penicillin acylase family protein [Pseudoxanthomonas winnipegensis]